MTLGKRLRYLFYGLAFMLFGVLCIIAGTTGFDLALGIVSCLYAMGPLYFAFFGKSS